MLLVCLFLQYPSLKAQWMVKEVRNNLTNYQYNAALSKIEQAYILQPNEEIEDLLHTCQLLVQSEKDYQQGLLAYNQGKTTEAGGFLRKVSPDDKKNYGLAQAKLEEIAQIKFKEAQSLYKSKQYLEAGILLKESIQFYPKLKGAKMLLEQCKTAREELEKRVEERSLENALQGMMENLPNIWRENEGIDDKK